MTKTLVFKKLVAFTVVLTLMFTAFATVISYAWSNSSTVTPKLFWGYTSRNRLVSSAPSGVDASQMLAQTKVYLGTNTSGSTVSKPTVGQLKNNGITIVPPTGWYVKTVIITCEDGSGYNCNTAANSNIVEFGNASTASAAYTITGAQFSAADSTAGKTVFHQGMGNNFYLMIQLAESPNPVSVKYVAGDVSGYTGKVNDGASDSQNISYTSSVPVHTVHGVNDALISAAEAQNKVFIGWKIEYFNDASFSASDTSVSADGVKQKNDQITLSRHALLTAQWEEVPFADYSVLYHFEQLDGSYNVLKDIEGSAAVGSVVSNAAYITSPNTDGDIFKGYTFDASASDSLITVTADNQATLDLYFDLNSYTVTYYVKNPDSSSFTQYAKETYKYGAIINDITPADKTGYTSNYWYTDDSLSVSAVIPDLMPDQNLEYYADYTVNQYTVSYYFNGVKTGATETYDFSESVTVRAFPTPAAGQEITASAWGCDYTAVTFTPGSSFNMPARNLSLYVTSTAKEYTVTWILVDGSTQHILHEDNGYYYNSELEARDHPTPGSGLHSTLIPEGYSAYGWYTDSSLTSSATIPSVVTDNHVFYAGLKKNTYKAYYFVDGVLLPDLTTEYEFGAPVTLKDAPAAALGSTLHYWYEDPDFPDTFGAGLPGSYGTMPAHNLYFYGWHEVNYYNVEYYLNGVRLTSEQLGGIHDSFEYNAPVTYADVNTVKPIGYDIKGWYNSPKTNAFDSLPAPDTFPVVMPAETVKLYAYTSEATFHVSYWLDGVKVSGDIPVKYNATYTADSFVNQFTLPSGHVMVGDTWLIHTEIAFGLVHVAPGGSFTMPAANVELHAESKIGQYPLNYYIVYDDGTPTAQYSTTVYYDYGTNVTLLDLPTINSAQYSYIGWFESESCTGTEFTSVTMTATGINVYAKATTNKYTVEYHIDGVKQGETVSVPYGTTYTTKKFSDFTITGKSFVGDSWIVRSRASTPITSVVNGASFIMPAQNLILEAVTSANDYEVNYYIVDENGTTTLFMGPVEEAFGSDVELADVPVDSEHVYSYSNWTADPAYASALVWNTINGEDHFVMPAHNVDFYANKTKVNTTYTVRYLDKATDLPIKSEEVTKDAVGAAISKTQPEIFGYDYDGSQQTVSITLDKDDSKNIITFYYVEKPKEFNINYYVIDTNGITTLYDGPIIATVGSKVDLIDLPVSVDGSLTYTDWVADEEFEPYMVYTVNSGVRSFEMHGHDINFYTTASTVPASYTIRFVNYYGGLDIATPVVKTNIVGATVTENQPVIDKYAFAEGTPSTVSITLSANSSDNVITFYYIRDYGEHPYRVEYKVYDPNYDTGDSKNDHIMYRTLYYYDGVAEWGETITALPMTFDGYTEMPNQQKAMTIVEGLNRLVILYTDDSLSDTPNYYVRYFFNGKVDWSKTYVGTGKVGEVVKAEDHLLDNPEYTLIGCEPEEITLDRFSSKNIIRIYYAVEEPTVPPTEPVVPPTEEPEQPSVPEEPTVEPEEPTVDPENDEPVVDEPNVDDPEDEPEDIFVPETPPQSPNTSDVSFIYGIMAIVSALAATGVFASRKMLR